MMSSLGICKSKYILQALNEGTRIFTISVQESGDGKFGITWSFTACPGSGRKLIESSRKLIVSEARTEIVGEL